MGMGLLLLFLLCLLVGPYLLLLSQFSFSYDLDVSQLGWALENTLQQALWSAAMSVLLGLLGGLGCLWLRRRVGYHQYFWFEKALLLPNMLPSLFVVVACLGLIPHFPFGSPGIVFIHTLMHIGIVSILFCQIAVEKLETLGALALVEGASFWSFIRVGIFGFLTRDLFYLFLFVFAGAVVSFNVPLLVGGTSGTTLEVLVYEKLVFERNWSEALTLSFIQVVLIGVVSLFTLQTKVTTAHKSEDQILEIIEWKWGLIFPLSALCMVVLPPLAAFPKGIVQLQFLKLNWDQLLLPGLYSFFMGLVVGGVFLCLGLIACLGIERLWWRRFLMLYLPPGAVLLGFSFLVLDAHVSFPVLLEVVFGLAILYFAPLVRLSLLSTLDHLMGQVEVGKVLGASSIFVYKVIILPQVIRPLATLSGIASLWACGDFAFSSLLSSDEFHLALLIKGLASSYRLDGAQTLMVALYFISAFSMFFWWEIGNVISRKLDNRLGGFSN